MSARRAKKKLIDVVRWFFKADNVNQDYCTNTCMAVRKKKTHCTACPKPVLFPGNTTVFDLFFSCFSQWRWDMHGNRFIDYHAVKVAAEFMTVEIDADLFEKFRVMESEYLKIIEDSDNGS